MKSSKRQPKSPTNESYAPRGQSPTQFVTILPDWHGVSFIDPFDPRGVTIHRVVGPDKTVYRYAYGWEHPDVLIIADILPTEHSIRLVRERSKPLRLMVRRTLREQRKRART